MDRSEEKALLVAESLTRLLGVPHEYLKGSRMKVNPSGERHACFELWHDGTGWFLRQRTILMDTDEAYMGNTKHGLQLSETAIGWLLAQAITKTPLTTDSNA